MVIALSTANDVISLGFDLLPVPSKCYRVSAFARKEVLLWDVVLQKDLFWGHNNMKNQRYRQFFYEKFPDASEVVSFFLSLFLWNIIVRIDCEH